MSPLWIGPLASGAGAALCLTVMCRAMAAERHATVAATDSLRALRPVAAGVQAHARRRLAAEAASERDMP
jgi:hypothetical protein